MAAAVVVVAVVVLVAVAAGMGCMHLPACVSLHCAAHHTGCRHEVACWWPPEWPLGVGAAAPDERITSCFVVCLMQRNPDPARVYTVHATMVRTLPKLHRFREFGLWLVSQQAWPPASWLAGAGG